jgi:uncharacterized protein
MLRVDVFALCVEGARQEGRLPIAKSERLRAECVSEKGEVAWVLTGDLSKRFNDFPTLHLSVHGTVPLQCQRCLEPFDFSVQSESTFVLAKDEQSAERIEAMWEDDDTVDVIVGSKIFDVLALIEDEVLLAIPLSPKHDRCEGVLGTQVTESPKKSKESPFAAIKGKLKD